MSKDLEKTIAVKSLTRRLIGSILVEDIKDVYSALIYKLELTDVPSKKHFFPLFSKRKYPFTFTLRKAIRVMENLSVDIQLGSTLARISYQTKPKLELELLQLFFSAKLLHSPFERTLEKVCDLDTILQPTPKGVAILHWYCQRIGVNQMNDFKLPEILKSNFNSMELITFERDSRSNSIIHNEYWDKLLFRQIMGTKMNTWSFDSGPDPIQNFGNYFNTIMEKDDDITQSIINPSLILENETEFFKYLKKRQDEYEINQKCTNITPKDKCSDSKPKNDAFDKISPFFHRFFTNPDSDSHIQYYTSNKGIRFFKSKTFTKNNKRITIAACFSGKALVQYLLDCTDIMHKKEAVKIANCFIYYNLIKCCSIENSSRKFFPTRDALYVLTEAAFEILQWPDDDIENNEKQSKNIHSSSNLPSHYRFDKMKSLLFDEFSNQNKDEYDDGSINSITSKFSDGAPGLPSQIDFKSSTNSSLLHDNLSLASILKDPGMKHLLRQFMIDNLCVENLNAYDDILRFQSRFFVLKKLLSLKSKAKERYLKKTEIENTSQDVANAQKVLITFSAAIKTLCESSLIKVYNIYAMYLTENAPNELNIDSTLRLKIEKFINDQKNINIVHSSTPVVSKNDDRENDMFEKGEMQKSSNTIKLENENLEVRQKGDKEEEKENINREKENDENYVCNESVPSTLTLSFVDRKSLNLELSPTSPTNITLVPTLNFLNEIDRYYNQLKLTVIKIMETDSLNKFLNSGLLNESSIALHKLK